MSVPRRIPVMLAAAISGSTCAPAPKLAPEVAADVAPEIVPEIATLSWLAGCWASEGGEPGSGEHWTSLAGQTMLGTSRTVKAGRTVGFEFMELRHLPDGKLAFIAYPSGDGRTVFPVLRISASEVVFENAQHDFPQRVAYSREGDSRLRARIEGNRQGALRVIEFPMIREACDSESKGLVK